MNTIDFANPKMKILPHAKLDWVPLYVADENAVIIGDPCHGVKILLYGITIPSSDLYQKILNEKSENLDDLNFMAMIDETKTIVSQML